MPHEQQAPETKGVTVKLLSTVDLGPEIDGMTGRQLRMRLVRHSARRRLWSGPQPQGQTRHGLYS